MRQHCCSRRLYNRIKQEQEKIGGTMSKPEYQKEYVKRTYKQIKFELNRNTDKDLIEFLETVDNKQGLLKRLLREEMKKSRGE